MAARMSRLLILFGVVLLLAGLFWPWVSRIPLGRLPGDLIFHRGSVTIYLPITTMIIVSLLLTLVSWWLRK